MSDLGEGFSFQTRNRSLARFQSEVFDLLVIGGGITGAAVARDAVLRGLNVALVERKDFAFGTSSRSSKLIHGGLRYLENFELKLVFEALSERTLLLNAVPHLVRPLPFFLPVFRGDRHGKSALSIGLWLYDLLAFFRSPGFHKRLSKKDFLKSIPFLRSDGLMGGFQFYDAAMSDDVIVVQTLRSAYENGAAVANYVEAVKPLWEGDRISGFKVRDLEVSSSSLPGSQEGEQHDPSLIHLRAHRTVLCTGPWTDQIGIQLTQDWNRWLTPSKGVHLVFDLHRIPLPGAVMMTNPSDGRIAFVIPRPEYGAGIVLVGTTDGPTSQDPDQAKIDQKEVQYLLDLLSRYFPTLHLSQSDILSAYVGVRPLMGGEGRAGDSQSSVLQKVSREHHIAEGPGGTVVVAGGKYTTHRKMAEEVVDFTLRSWKKDVESGKSAAFPKRIGPSQSRLPMNGHGSPAALKKCIEEAQSKGLNISKNLLSRYGEEALEVLALRRSGDPVPSGGELAGFPDLAAQLRYCIRNEMVMHLEDFYLRRVPLYASRKDHGWSWAKALAEVWAQERGLSEKDASAELARLRVELERRSAWQN